MWENKHEQPAKQGINPLVFVVAGVVVVLLGVCIALFVKSTRNQTAISQSDTAVQSETDAGFGDTIFYEGEEYQLNPNITTVLFLGIDQNEDDRDYTITGGGRSDAIMLLLLNDETQTITMLQISRDTMVTVDFYSLQDEYSFSSEMQITMQYSAGTSTVRSNWLSTQKISELLYDTTIDYTVSLSMDGISLLVDALGGIELTIPADYTSVNELFVEGETIVLDGELAYEYIQYRDTEDFGSNNGRMERQAQLIRALASKLSGNVSSEMIETLQTVASPYMESNLSAQVIENLSTYTLLDTIYTPEGENVEGTHDEFYVDDAALRALVIELFYQKV